MEFLTSLETLNNSKITGENIISKTPKIPPIINDNIENFLAYSMAFSLFFLPISCPIITKEELAIPIQNIINKF
ncbi:hypothetical protein D3C73_1234000 [compost metagenome]